MKKILVTGGAGFIGSNFLNIMTKKYPNYYFVNVDNLTYAGNMQNLSNIDKSKNYTFIKADITEKKDIEKIFEQHNIDTVINFAAESHVDKRVLRIPVYF